MDKAELIRRGQAAKSILENPDFKLVMDTVRIDVFRAWSNSSPEEAPKREEQYYLLQAIAKLEDNLAALAAGARLEEYKAEQHKTQPNGEHND